MKNKDVGILLHQQKFFDIKEAVVGVLESTDLDKKEKVELLEEIRTMYSAELYLGINE